MPSQPAAAPEGSLSLALPNNTLWDCGRVLDFAFLNGSDGQKATFRAAAAQWTQYANLLMKFDQPTNIAEFRVGFDNEGNWSYVGTGNLQIPTPGKTMNIWNMSSILHEVGHALGCVHEHSSPSSNIQWNKPVVYQALGGPPNNWDHAKVDHNVFLKYDGATTQFSAFDPNSIMLYFFPASWTLNGVGTHANDTLSGTDQAFIRRCYPGCTADFSKPEIATGACRVSYGPRVMYNSYYGNSWIMNQPNASFIEVNFNQPKQYGGRDIYSKAHLKMVHLTSMNGPSAGSSPIDIVVNGTVFKRDYSPPSGNYMTDDWDITNLMRDGANTIRLNFKNAVTNYWIQSLQVLCDRILY
jgi:Astacin (Peptidase family M12A).